MVGKLGWVSELMGGWVDGDDGRGTRAVDSPIHYRTVSLF